MYLLTSGKATNIVRHRLVRAVKVRDFIRPKVPDTDTCHRILDQSGTKHRLSGSQVKELSAAHPPG